MGENSSPNTTSEILKALHEFLSEPEVNSLTLPLEKINQDLRPEGINTTSLIEQVREKIAKAKAKALFAQAHKRRQYFLEKLKNHVETSSRNVPLLKEQVLEYLSNLFADKPEIVMAYFRKFEEASESDIQSLLEDITLLDRLRANDNDSNS
jgi:hypothetical protein